MFLTQLILNRESIIILFELPKKWEHGYGPVSCGRRWTMERHLSVHCLFVKIHKETKYLSVCHMCSSYVFLICQLKSY